MRVLSALLLILSVGLVSSTFAAQKPDAKAPEKKPAQPTEQIYLDSEVDIDEINQAAYDKDGIPISGTIRGFYPNGRLAWETQWVDGKLHGVTKGYHANRKLKEETTWINGKLHGPAKWYDEKGHLLRETMYENDKDLTAPDKAQATDASEQGETKDTSSDQDKAPGKPQ